MMAAGSRSRTLEQKLVIVAEAEHRDNLTSLAPGQRAPRQERHPAEALVAHVLVAMYADHLPLYR